MLALVWCDRNSWCFRTSNRNSEYLLQLTNPKTAQLIELPCGAYYIDKVDSIVSFFLLRTRHRSSISGRPQAPRGPLDDARRSE